MQSSPTHDFEARARRHVVTALRMAGVALATGRPLDLRIDDRRFFAFIYHHGMEGLEQARRLGWWSCADPPRLYARLERTRARRDGIWSLKGPAVAGPRVSAA